SIDEAESGTAPIVDVPGDLTTVAKAMSLSSVRAYWTLESCEGAIAIEEALHNAICICTAVLSNDLASVVDAVESGVVRIQGIIESGVSAVAVDETVLAGSVGI